MSSYRAETLCTPVDRVVNDERKYDSDDERHGDCCIYDRGFSRVYLEVLQCNVPSILQVHAILVSLHKLQVDIFQTRAHFSDENYVPSSALNRSQDCWVLLFRLFQIDYDAVRSHLSNLISHLLHRGGYCIIHSLKLELYFSP